MRKMDSWSGREENGEAGTYVCMYIPKLSATTIPHYELEMDTLLNCLSSTKNYRRYVYNISLSVLRCLLYRNIQRFKI